MATGTPAPIQEETKMTTKISRRPLAALLAAPALIGVGTARAQGQPLKIGVPTAMTGTWAALGSQVVRSCRLWQKVTNAEGGLLGRPIEFLFEDTQGTPANCLRKAQEMVERDRVNILLGLMASSEALAVMPKLAEWNALFISSVNGAGSITAESWVPNAFRANTSGPMGARALALWLRNSPQTDFFSLSLDYAWGRSSVETFEGLLRGIGKRSTGSVFAPVGTRDYSSFITRVRQANPQALYIALTGDDGTAFLRQAAQYRLFERMPVVTETVDMLFTRPAGEAAIGLVGGSRYSFAYDIPANNQFVQRFRAEYNDLPDTYDGEQWQACEVLAAAIRKAGSTETPQVVAALRDLELSSIKGPLKIRACDGQAEQQGFVVRVARREGFPYPVPDVISTFTAAEVTPACRASNFT
jgi:branched-chain amino acid transport system substrate-binding protein